MRNVIRAAVAAALVLLAYSVVSATLVRGVELMWRQAAWFDLGNWFE